MVMVRQEDVNGGSYREMLSRQIELQTIQNLKKHARLQK